MANLKINKKHQYSIGKKKLRSATEFVGSFFNPFDAKGIARKLAKFPVNRMRKQGVRYWLTKWKQDQDFGREVHLILEHKFKNIVVTNTSGRADVIANMAYSRVKDAIVDRIKPDVINPEMKIWNEDIGIAGTADLVLFKGDKVYIVDWKVTKKITDKSYDGKFALAPISHLEDCSLNRYTLQLSLYAYMIELANKKKIENLYLVHCTEEKISIFDLPYEKETIRRMIEHEKTNK